MISNHARPKIGVIGVGEMGRPIALNLVRAEYSVTAYDISKEALDEIGQHGVTVSTSAIDLAKKSDLIITILPNADAVRSSVLGSGGILQVLHENHTLIEMSTIDVGTTKELERKVKQKGAAFIDAPIGGTPDRASTRDLLILASGDKAVVDICMDVMNAIAKNVEYVGKAGSGKIVKLTNNLLIAIHKVATAEAVSFALKQGIDPDILIRSVIESTGDSRVFERFCGAAVGKDRETGKRHSWHLKDLGLILDLSRESGVSLPMANFSRDIIQAATEESGGQENFDSLVGFYKKNMKLELADSLQKTNQ